jgi:hypothetical protein
MQITGKNESLATVILMFPMGSGVHQQWYKHKNRIVKKL